MKTIVIIDDEFGLTDVLAAALQDFGYRVLVAANGVQGMQVMAADVPDLVLLDYMMPLMNGPAVLQAMRANPALASVPVILMSAMPESSVRGKCSGYVSFLRKPFEFEGVFRAIEHALG
jgi:CheY-like chemotaxis protein